MTVDAGQPPVHGSRLAPLDGLRGIAVGLVILVHCFYFTPDTLLAVAWNRISGLGFLGVDLFFVLSGYLITGILIRERSAPHYFRNFYARRFLRIFPAYYLVLAFVLLVMPHFDSFVRDARLGDKAWILLTYLQNWYMAYTGRGFAWAGLDHFWSLAIEEQFYLAWPLLIWLTPPKHLRTLALSVVVLSIAAKLAALALGMSWTLLYVSTFTHTDGLAWGACLATLATADLPRWRPWVRALAGAGALVFAALIVIGVTLKSKPMIVSATTAATFLFGAAIFAIHARSLPGWGARLLTHRSLTMLGQYSYGLYLWHYVVYWPIRVQVSGWLGTDDSNISVLTTGLLTSLLSLILAVLMYRLMEAPLLSLRRYFYDGAPSAAAAPAPTSADSAGAPTPASSALP